ncbi:MAG: transposase [Nitrospirales bacterium]|nr:transposase [Nitrospirales bacterium]
MSIRDVAKEVHLDWHTVKGLEQLRRTGIPAHKVIGIDEIALKKGHTYQIVVSDLERRRPIWFGGQDRSEESLDAFYGWVGPKKRAGVRLTVMDMGKAFE